MDGSPGISYNSKGIRKNKQKSPADIEAERHFD